MVASGTYRRRRLGVKGAVAGAVIVAGRAGVSVARRVMRRRACLLRCPCRSSDDDRAGSAGVKSCRTACPVAAHISQAGTAGQRILGDSVRGGGCRSSGGVRMVMAS